MLVFENFGVGPWTDEFHRRSEIHRKLADDLNLIAMGRGPSDEDMYWSPYLDRYQMTFRSRPCLHGFASGHPKLAPLNREILTSELIAISPQLKLARTRSRWYRLGELEYEWEYEGQ